MSDPFVCAVMLANGRQEMVDRAVRSYLAQTYKAKHLFLLDTGDPLLTLPRMTVEDSLEIYMDHTRPRHAETIGALRNRANYWAKSLDCDIIAHWDSDDWSHPNRLTEQVALLQASNAECVGYNQALFWDARSVEFGNDRFGGYASRNEAWLYTSPKSDVALGGTLCYWRRTWEAKRFLDLKFGEDTAWQTGMRVAAVSGLGTMDLQRADCGDPRFIAHVHGGNTSSVITPNGKDWQRMPEWDAYCSEAMDMSDTRYTLVQELYDKKNK